LKLNAFAYAVRMDKRITESQILGELGETVVKKIVLENGFIYEPRGRLEAGTDGLIELRDPKTGSPLGKWLGVQVKSTADGRYTRETEDHFEYLLKPQDLRNWRQSNIPIIIVVWRKSDNSAYWKEVTDSVAGEERRLFFSKNDDVFDGVCGDRLGALTVDRRTPGVFLPPLNGGEGAIINMLRIRMPDEIFISTSPFGSGRDAFPELLEQDDIAFDWVIRKRRFISFSDPRSTGVRAIVDEDQVEAVETALLADSDDQDDVNDVIHLLRRTLERQLSQDLAYSRHEGFFYFKAFAPNAARRYQYMSSSKKTAAGVVSVYPGKGGSASKAYVRHHAATFRFERLGDEWFVVIDPTFFFTNDGFSPHRYAGPLLAGKKRLERNAAVRGQVIMWQHLLVESGKQEDSLLSAMSKERPVLAFETLPIIDLPSAVPEASWMRTDPRAEQMVSMDLLERLMSA